MSEEFYGKGITIASGFDLGAKSPLDSRSIVNTIEERNAHVIGNRVYEGMRVYVLAEKKEYRYNGDDWEEVGGITDEQLEKLTIAYEHSQTPHVTEEYVDAKIADTNSYVDEMLGGKRLVYLTQAEYDNLTEEEKNNTDIVYNITDSSGFDGDYNSLTNKPNIPTKTSELVNDSTYVTESGVLEIVENSGLGGTTEVSQGETEPTEESVLLWIDTTSDENMVENNLSDSLITEFQDSISTLNTRVSTLEKNIEPPFGEDAHTHSNKVVLDKITQAYFDKWNNKSDFNGSYNSLTDKPTIPTRTSELINNSNYVTTAEMNQAIADIPVGEQVDLTNYQTKTDNALNTTDKTVIGAINEVNSNLGSKVSSSQLNAAISSYVAENRDELKGDKGDKGDAGAKGQDGLTPTLSVGTVTTGNAGSNAIVTMTGSSPNYTLNFTIPKGDKGDSGSGGNVDLTNYQTKTDDTLETIDKTISGAINEINTLLGKCLPFEDSYVSNCNTWLTNGYTKTSTSTTNHPSVCTGADRWGIIFFIAENAELGTGTQMYFPIDGTYRGAIFTRSIVKRVVGKWKQLATISDIPTQISELTNDSNFATETFVTTKISEASLSGGGSSFSGSYNDLTDKPTIPTKTSDLTNDSGYLTSVPSEYITETELTSMGYATETYVNTKIDDYQTKTDNTLETTDKTIVGAINEILSMLKNSEKDTLTLSCNFENNVAGSAYGAISLISNNAVNDGNYEIRWANNDGILNSYKAIDTCSLNGDTSAHSYNFISTNAIPVEATKIAVLKDGNIIKSYNIPSNKLITSQKIYSFGLLSDVHVDGDGNDEAYSESDFNTALTFYSNENVDTVCFSGDVTCDGRESDVTLLKSIKGNFSSMNFYTARGNHDCRNVCNLTYYTTNIEPNGLYFEKIINNDVFLFLGMANENYADTIFTTEELDWLEEKLETYRNQRVFLFEHVFIPPVGNVGSLYPYSSLSSSGTASKRFMDMMAHYRNVILCTGHSHLEFELQRVGDNANCSQRTSTLCHRIHTPSCTRPRANDSTTADTSANTYNRYAGSQGYLIDVYDNFIILKGRDFIENKYLPLAQYIIDTTPISIESSGSGGGGGSEGGGGSGTVTDYTTDSLELYLNGSEATNTTSLIKDLSGNGNDFVATNITLDSGAIKFNGSSMLRNSTFAPLNTLNEDFTLEFVVSNFTPSKSGSIMSLGTATPNRATTQLRASVIKIASESSVDLAYALDSANKHHYMIIKSGDNIALYVDNVQVVTKTYTMTSVNITSNFIIGAKYDSHATNNRFDGELYLYRLYTKALTDTERNNNYNDYLNRG